MVTTALKAPLAAAMRDRSDPDPVVRQRSDRYAASTRVVCDVLAQQAKQMTKPAPLVYRNLTGKFGLATEDPAWAALAQPGRRAGLGLVTNGIAQGDEQTRATFPTTRASTSVRMSRRPELVFDLQDSDIVCFRSAAADADGYHSLVQVAWGLLRHTAFRDGDPREGAAAGRVGGARPQGAAAAVHGARDVQEGGARLQPVHPLPADPALTEASELSEAQLAAISAIEERLLDILAAQIAAEEQ